VDKLYHFAAGLAVAYGALWLGADVGEAILASAFVAVGKEIWDMAFGGDPDALDAIATVAGGLMVAL